MLDGASWASVRPLRSWLLTRFAPPMRANRAREAPALMGLLADSERPSEPTDRRRRFVCIEGASEEDRQAALSQGLQQMQPVVAGKWNRRGRE